MSDYQGWKNYETWCVKLWIDNEQSDYEYWREETRSLWTCNDGDADVTRYQLADALKTSFDDAAPELRGMWADLLSAALSEVDWGEIAQAMIDDEDFEEPEAEAQS